MECKIIKEIIMKPELHQFTQLLTDIEAAVRLYSQKQIQKAFDKIVEIYKTIAASPDRDYIVRSVIPEHVECTAQDSFEIFEDITAGSVPITGDHNLVLTNGLERLMWILLIRNNNLSASQDSE